MLLESKELRLGNIVQYNNTECFVYDICSPQPRKGRYNNEFLLTLSLNGLIDCLIDEIEPVELTEKWLIKFGFKYNKQIGWTKDGLCLDGPVVHFSFDLFRNESLTNYHLLDFVEIPRLVEYVHELQNLYFALTNVELPLNNVK